MNEIGSEFAYDPSIFQTLDYDWKKHFPAKHMVFLSSGRDSIIYFIRAHNIKKILVPSYVEELILKLFQSENVKINFYKIDENLNIDLDDIKKKSYDVDAIFLNHYFGFVHSLTKIESFCQENNIILVEDCVQSMLSTFEGKPIGSFGDVSLNSLRKFIGIPDGSILTIKKRTDVFESKLHKKYVDKKTSALIGKFNYLKGDKNYSRYYFKDAFVDAEKVIYEYKKPAPMTTESLNMLKKINFEKIIKIRRKNFRYLLSNLDNIAFYKKLPHNICPLGFPIICKNRSNTKKILIKNKIYPAIHWELSNEIKKNEFHESWKISKSILTIPIDQRYSIEDMERIVSVLRKIDN